MSAINWLIGLLVMIGLLVGVIALNPGRTPVDETAALLQADVDFAAATLSRGGNGWAEYFARDGIMFPHVGRIDGREAIREVMLPFLAPGKPLLKWEPGAATVAESGDVGYTVGRWMSVGTTTAGADTILAEGNYVSIWEKDPVEGWRVAVDIGNRDIPPAARGQ